MLPCWQGLSATGWHSLPSGRQGHCATGNGRVACWVALVHLQPVVIVIVCHAIATDGGVGGVLDHGLCLAWIHVSVSVRTAWLVVWKPLCLDPSDGVFGRFDLAALCGCHTLNVCCCCLLLSYVDVSLRTNQMNCEVIVPKQLPITNYQMALSKQGAGGGSATHKEPT